MKSRRTDYSPLWVGLFVGLGAAIWLTRGPTFSREFEYEMMRGGTRAAFFPMWLALWEMGLVHELPRANDPAYNVSLVERGLLASGDSRPFCERYADRIIAGDLRDPPNGSDAMDAFVLRTHLGTVEVCAVQLARRR